MTTLYEQLREVAIAEVNEFWWGAVSPTEACTQLLAKAYKENWPRKSFKARVILRFSALIGVGCVSPDEPGVDELL